MTGKVVACDCITAGRFSLSFEASETSIDAPVVATQDQVWEYFNSTAPDAATPPPGA